MRVALILNPRSGSIGDPAALVEGVRARCSALTVHEVGCGAQAASSSPDRLLVAGGDGSIGDAFAAAARAGVPLGVIPTGTANDFARALQLPTERGAALALALDPEASRRAVWGGTVAGRPFVNVASVGLGVDAAERAVEFKAPLGPLAYVAGAVHAGIVGRRVQTVLEVNGGEVARGKVFQLLIGASGRFGGGSGLGEAELTDRRLVATWVPATSRLELPLRALGLASRTIERQAGVDWWKAERLMVRARIRGRGVAWNVDGEVWHPPPGPVELLPLGPVTVLASD